MSAADKQVHIFSSTETSAVEDVKVCTCPRNSESLTELDQWALVQPRVFVQADGYSCGVAAIDFILAISKCEQLAQCAPVDLEPETYREKLQLYIATTARRESLVEMCSKCFRKTPATSHQKEAVHPSATEKSKC
ncbi:Hypothetical protein NTJ_14096 [Nesidiocoris tenuis]|uniref:Ubiquitin-like protease family profile domain-containing protein n=1 Tax=Nesidiocoris tenuis TaxID=355587 RepID=A0ABN7BC77_9HEMI|nr:Hypothetical protein NTJ_14096 [Nesidiocoris tenuis]